MVESAWARIPVNNPQEKIIVALDVETAGAARELVSELSGRVGAFKIGLQLFTAAGPEFVRDLTDAGERVFLDLKFHDIPNTVAKAAIEAAKLGVWMFNVHTLGGAEMMKRAYQDLANFCSNEGIRAPHLIGVTVLTSADKAAMEQVGIEHEVVDEVLRLAKLAAECGIDGVVASALETRMIRDSVPGSGFLIVTPGVRPIFATNDDQKRVTTPGEAVSSGSDYLVIGRPITKASDRQQAVSKIVEEIAALSR